MVISHMEKWRFHHEKDGDFKVISPRNNGDVWLIYAQLVHLDFFVGFMVEFDRLRRHVHGISM